MPKAILKTKQYMTLFGNFRNANRSDGEWQVHGVEWLQLANKAIKAAGNKPYDNDADGYDDLRAKHNSTRMSFRKKVETPINEAFSITEWRKVGRKNVPVVSHLSDDRQMAYALQIQEADKLINDKMPGLPPYDGTGRTQATGEDMTGWLG